MNQTTTNRLLRLAVILSIVGVFLLALAVLTDADAEGATLTDEIPADCAYTDSGTLTCENPDYPATTVPDGCAEDDPCWDCNTMGNQQCGTPDYPTPSPSPDYPAPARPTPIEPAFTG